jgi:20S proteasome alpha/beta subunit
MDTAFGITGKDFVLLVSDATVPRSIFKLKEHEDKIMQIDDNKLIALGGEISDAKNFGNWV